MNLYEKIYKDIKNRIDNGEFNGGKLLPTEGNLQEQYSVSRITVKHAYDMLTAEGIIVRIPGKGTVLAESNSKSQNRLIGVVLCDFNSAFGERMLKSIEKKAAEYGYGIVLRRSLDNHNIESRVLSELIHLNVRGIIVQNCHGAFTKNLIELSLQDFPLVSVDRYAKGLLIPSVTSDNFNSCVHAAEYLINKGHKKILLASANPQSTSTLTERLEGFKQAHINCGTSLSSGNFAVDLKSPITGEQNDITNDISNISRLLEQESISAVIATERFAAELCAQAIDEIGKRIPDDYELICFDYEDEYSFKSKYTHIRQNEEEMGRQAVEQLIKLINNESAAMRTVINSDFVLGNSTRR